MDFTRRRLVAGAAVAPLMAAGCISPDAASMKGNATSSMTFEPGSLSPRETLDTLVRLRGDLAQPVWLWFEGRVYGRPPDGLMTPMFGFTSLLRVRYEMISDTRAAFEQRESAHYTDLATGAPVGGFYNPYTRKTNIAVGYVSPKFRYEFTADGAYSTRSGKKIGTMMEQLATDGTHVWTSERRENTFPAGIDADIFPDAFVDPMRQSVDIATYKARLEDLAAPAPAFVPATTDFVADIPWPLWMFMGDRPGFSVWIGHGAKTQTLDALPDDLRRRVAAVHPGFMDNPFEVDASAWTTAGQMMELRRAGRI